MQPHIQSCGTKFWERMKTILTRPPMPERLWTRLILRKRTLCNVRDLVPIVKRIVSLPTGSLPKIWTILPYFTAKILLVLGPVFVSLQRLPTDILSLRWVAVVWLQRHQVQLLVTVTASLLVVTSIIAPAQPASDGEESPHPSRPVQLVMEETTFANSVPVERDLPRSSDTSLESANATASEGRIADYSDTNDRSPFVEAQIPHLPRSVTDNIKVLVAVLDTGIDKRHEDLADLVVAEANFSDSYRITDSNGHGTHIAGIIAAKDNEVGILGVAPGCLLLNAKVADENGTCEAAALAEGIVWAVDNEASVINISIELKEPSHELKEAINYAWERGSLIVAAAGNSGDESLIYPASYENCIAVCCLKENGELFLLSNHGDWIDVAAPGCNIYSCLPDNCYGYKTGTSFATAYVSGIAALLFGVVTDSNGDGKLNDEVRKLIESGCY